MNPSDMNDDATRGLETPAEARPWTKRSPPPPPDFPRHLPIIEDVARPSRAIRPDSVWTLTHPWPDRCFGPQRGQILCRDGVGMCLEAAEHFHGPFWYAEPRHLSDVRALPNAHADWRRVVSGHRLLELYRAGFFFDFDVERGVAGISHLNSRDDVQQLFRCTDGQPGDFPMRVNDRYLIGRHHRSAKLPVRVLEQPIAFIVRVLNTVGATTRISCSGHGQKAARIEFINHAASSWARSLGKLAGLGYVPYYAMFIPQSALDSGEAFLAAEAIYLNRFWCRHVKTRFGIYLRQKGCYFA
ncbi:hypothetical protein [Thiocystis minor]|uniref:hypothetical protein n=1 Tax=Thiocystis minor TaxID=61597 RepID=UPI0019125BA5|nr:hypothetical protein [Thiocystis minor]